MKLFVFVISLFTLSLLHAKQAVTYCIESQKGINCSATLLRVDGQCKLVTNAHCVNDGSDKVIIKNINNYIPKVDQNILNIQRLTPSLSKFSTKDLINKNVVWNYEKQFFDDKTDIDTEAKIKIFDTTKDLALLEVPEKILNGACKDLDLIWNQDRASLERSKQGIVAVGCTRENQGKKHHPKVSYTSNTFFDSLKGKPHFEPARIESIPSAYKDSKELYYVRDFLATPGQSGGTSYSESGGFLGIQTRANLTQDRVWIIPAQDVLAYARNPSSSTKPNPYDKLSIDLIGDSDGTGTGDPDGTGTGDSDGTGTGDPDGTGTGDSDGTGTGDSDGTGTKGDCHHCKESSLEYFSSNEGKFLEEIGDVLISLDGKILNDPGEIQQFGSSAVRIKRDPDGYLPIEIRKNILKNLVGSYPFEESVHKKVKRENKNKNWEVKEEGKFVSNLKIESGSQESYTLSLKLEKHLMTLPNHQFFDALKMKHYEKQETFNVRYSNNYKKILLKRGNEVLVCDNKHYLKLFCKGQKRSLSLSVTNPNNIKSGLKYRYISNGNTESDYFYGENK